MHRPNIRRSRCAIFYSEKLGLEPDEARPGGFLYFCGSGSFGLFASNGTPPGTHTQMGLEVTDLRAAVAVLRARGVVWNYASKGGKGELAAWFKDSEGNMIALGQALR
jgi:predicted enzyme related to lactoylglutathione lyase